MVPGLTTAFGVMPHWAGAQVFVVDDGSEADTVAHGSLHGKVFVMCFFLGDLFHRAWNDFKWALKCAKGWQHHSMMQLCHAFNVNYGPFPRGGNTAIEADTM